MATNPNISLRLRPVILAYINDLARAGSYGKGRSGVLRRFIENGITRALERGVIEKRDALDFGESPDDEDEED
jgi:hypothetical protein